MNSDHNPVVVKINMKLKRTNSTKRSRQLEFNLLKEEKYKYKYNVEVKIFMKDYAYKRQNNNQIMEFLITNVTKNGLLLNNP